MLSASVTGVSDMRTWGSQTPQPPTKRCGMLAIRRLWMERKGFDQTKGEPPVLANRDVTGGWDQQGRSRTLGDHGIAEHGCFGSCGRSDQVSIAPRRPGWRVSVQVRRPLENCSKCAIRLVSPESPSRKAQAANSRVPVSASWASRRRLFPSLTYPGLRQSSR